MNNNYKPPVIFILFLILLISSPLYSILSSLKGFIKEKGTKKPLENVKITLLSLKNTSVRFEMETNDKGYFFLSGLQNGLYSVNYNKEGYTPYQQSIRLKVADNLELDIEMEPIKRKTTQTSYGLVTQAQNAMKEGKYDEAIEKVTKAMEKDPEAFILYYNRALAYEKKGDKEKALLDFKKSLELKPDFVLSISCIGNILAKKSDFNGAVEYYKKAFDLGLDDALALYNYGACLINIGDNEQAEAVFEKIIGMDPEYADAYYQMGIIYLGKNDNAKAKEFLEKFIELDPENSNAAVAKEILGTLN
jgi:tetratricopeptide (TPR) repeat protein